MEAAAAAAAAPRTELSLGGEGGWAAGGTGDAAGLSDAAGPAPHFSQPPPPPPLPPLSSASEAELLPPRPFCY